MPDSAERVWSVVRRWNLPTLSGECVSGKSNRFAGRRARYSLAAVEPFDENFHKKRCSIWTLNLCQPPYRILCTTAVRLLYMQVKHGKFKSESILSKVLGR